MISKSTILLPNGILWSQNIITYIPTGRSIPTAKPVSKAGSEASSSGQAKRNAGWKVFVATDGTHYFYIIRPSNNTPLGLRGTGGMFRMQMVRS